MSEQDRIKELVDKACDSLIEHVDSVRIFVTYHDGAERESGGYETGAGNFYAQIGQVQEWLAIQDQYCRNYAKRKDQE